MLVAISTFGTHRSHSLREHLFTDRQTDTHTQTDYNNPPAHARGLIIGTSFESYGIICLLQEPPDLSLQVNKKFECNIGIA